MTLRPIEPVDLGAIEMAPVTERPPTIEWVRPGDLLVDETYQRALSQRSMRLLSRIVRGWSWAKFKPPICARYEGRLLVEDGQHTALAAVTRGIELIPVLVNESAGAADQAESFISHNRDRLGMTPMQLFHAAVVAGDDAATAVARACQVTGVTVLRWQSTKFRPNDTMAVKALEGAYRRVGETGLVRVLGVLAPVKLAPIAAMHIRAVAAILFDQEYIDSIDDRTLSATIATHRESAPNHAAQLAAAHKIPLWKALAIWYFRNTRKRRAA